MRVNKIIIFILIFSIIIILFTGCWDKVEINDRAFVIGLGIDKKDDMYSITCAIPNLPVFTGQSSGGDPKFIKSAEDATIVGAYKKLATRLNRELNFDHVEVIIFGKDVFNNSKSVKEILDHLNRNTMYSLRVPVLISKESALKIFQITPEGAGAVGSYIADIYENNSKQVMRFIKLDLGHLFTQIGESKGMVLIPAVMEGNKDVKIGEVAIVKDYILKGWLNEEDVRSIRWIKGKGKGSGLDIKYKGKNLAYEISSSSSSMDFKLKDDKVYINIKIQSEGDIKEYYFNSDENLYDEKCIKKVQEEIEKYMKKQTEELIKKIQDNYKVDVIGIQNKLKLKSRKIYLKTKNNWNEYFSMAKINVESKVNIRRIGDSK